jgi:hypothetical protein
MVVGDAFCEREVPGKPLTEADYRNAAQEGGFTGNIVVGTDLGSLKTAVEVNGHSTVRPLTN